MVANNSTNGCLINVGFKLKITGTLPNYKIKNKMKMQRNVFSSFNFLSDSIVL